MNKYLGRTAAMAVIMAGALSASAIAQPAPDANISFHGGSVAFIGGVAWGSGRMHFQGHRYGLKVNGLSIGAIPAAIPNSVKASQPRSFFSMTYLEVRL